MKRKLFLTCALALASFVGVSAQWSRTLAAGTTGEQITHDVNGASVTQYRAETSVITPGVAVNSIRYTVLQTGALNQINGGGPCFALGEVFVLDAQGDTINFTVESNCDHNTLTGGSDGAGIPALNDGNFNNYFHSVWNETYAPAEYHYLEFNLEKSVDAFQLVWYTRPNQHQNRPLVIGLTPGGTAFTEDMMYVEYNYSKGAQVTTAEAIANGGNFTMYVDPMDEFEREGTTYGPGGDTYVSLSGYVVAENPTPNPTTIVQLIPTSDGKFIIYQPIAETYYGNVDSWTDGYNGSNGWQRASDIVSRLGFFEITPDGNGEYEITTYATRQYVDGAWQNYDEPLKLWVGYEIRGQLKLFPEGEKELLESGDYDSGKFHLPVDFSFRFDIANVDETLVPPLTAAEMCQGVIAPTIELANEKLEEYADFVSGDYDYEEAAPALREAITAAQEILAEEDVVSVFEAKNALTDAIRNYVAQKANYYTDFTVGELQTECDANFAEPPYNQSHTGMYTSISQSYIDRISELAGDIQSNYSDSNYSYSEIEAKYAEIESLIEAFYASTLKFTEFPAIIGEEGEEAPGTLNGNSQIWKNNLTLTSEVNGVRLTFLDNVIGNAGSGGKHGGYPMIALGEIKLYDGEGNEVELTADNFEASATEQNEEFDCGVARLCDGVITGSGSYFHSPWSGNSVTELVWIEITFPTAMDNFAVEIYGRDKSTTQDMVSLFPSQMAVSNLGEKYDPLLFTENPYNVFVGDQVTSVAEITEGLYVIKGLLDSSDTYNLNDEGEATGVAKFYEGSNVRYHESASAVREGSVYRIIPNGDGTYKFYSLKEAKYWPTTTDEGSYIVPTYTAADAAALKIVPATSGSFENTFVLYEEHAGLQSKDSIDTDEDTQNDTEMVYNTPYVVYMDWAGGVASRPVIDPQPRGGVADDILDSKGDSLHFNKGNGEGQWEIYKVAMDHPDFYLLSNMTGVVSSLGLIVGTDPGCVESLGSLEAPLAEAIQCVEDSNYAAAPAIATRLANEIASVDNLEKVPMAPGVYMIQSAYDEFYKQQDVTKSMYASVDEAGVASFGWKSTPEVIDETLYFSFDKSPDALGLELAGTLTAEEAAQCYNIRAIATYNGSSAWYIGEAEEQSVQIDLFEGMTANYVVKEATGSAFNFASPANMNDFCIHANGHGNGAGTGSNLVYWTADPSASQWYLKKVDYETSIEDLVTEGDEAVAVTYYTPAGAAVPAPVKGINIVVTVYANGVVESKKVLVK